MLPQIKGKKREKKNPKQASNQNNKIPQTQTNPTTTRWGGGEDQKECKTPDNKKHRHLKS